MVGSPRPRLPSPHRPRPTPTWPGLLQPGSRHPRLAVRLHHPPGLDPDLAGYRPGTPPPPVRPGRARPRARAVPAAELLAFLDADHPLRDKTLWWLAVRDRRPRQGEVLASTSPIWDLARRRAVVVGRGGRAEVIGWETKTARCCPDTCTAWPAWRSAPSPPSTR
jgi:hypothetical protein